MAKKDKDGAKAKKRGLPACKCCGKQWTKDETKGYRYISGVLACRCHHGIDEWYREELGKQKGK